MDPMKAAQEQVRIAREQEQARAAAEQHPGEPRHPADPSI
jgi:hypothetical protein